MCHPNAIVAMSDICISSIVSESGVWIVVSTLVVLVHAVSFPALACGLW